MVKFKDRTNLVEKGHVLFPFFLFGDFFLNLLTFFLVEFKKFVRKIYKTKLI